MLHSISKHILSNLPAISTVVFDPRVKVLAARHKIKFAPSWSGSNPTLTPRIYPVSRQPLTLVFASMDALFYCVQCSVVSDSLGPRGLEPTRSFYPWNFLGKNTGASCHFLLQGIFLTQGSTLDSCVSCIGRWIPYPSTTWEAPLFY